MNKLSQLGYHNIIDNFGVGYTNSKTLLYLDLFAVCVNLQTLKLTMSEETIKKFLILVHEIIKQINTNFLCFGVTTNEDITLLKETGVDHYQTEEKHIMK